MKCKYCPKELEGRKLVCYACKKANMRAYSKERNRIVPEKKCGICGIKIPGRRVYCVTCSPLSKKGYYQNGKLVL